MGLITSAIKIGSVPGSTAVAALRQATSPTLINQLSTAIARGSFSTLDEGDQTIITDQMEIEIVFDEDRLLTTAGFATALSLGTVYWLGERLRIKYRYDLMIKELALLRTALSADDLVESKIILDRMDKIATPLIDPDTLKPIANADEVAPIYESLFKRSANDPTMFKTSTFTTTIDDQIKLGSRIAVLTATSQTDEVLEAMIKKARPIAGKAVSRFVGAVLWVDTVSWIATSALALGLNYVGIDEEDQKIPILAEIPYIGALFDLSDSVGSSFVDLVISPIIEGVFDFFGIGEEEVEPLIDSLWAIITSAALNPTLTPFIIAILDFYIEEVNVYLTIPLQFEINQFDLDGSINIWGIFKPDPTDILVVWFYLIVIKIIFTSWIAPTYHWMIKE